MRASTCENRLTATLRTDDLGTATFETRHNATGWAKWRRRTWAPVGWICLVWCAPAAAAEVCVFFDLPPDRRRGGKVLPWLQNRRQTWWNVVEKRPVPPVKGATVTVPGLADGACEAEWWDTWKGAVIRKQRVQARQGTLALAAAPLLRDLAVKIRP